MKTYKKKKRPNIWWSTSSHLLLSIVSCLILPPANSEASQMPHSVNESEPTSGAGDWLSSSSLYSQFAVKDLKLMPDFRSVKLQWTYDRQATGGDSSQVNLLEPSAFEVRHCELTSWNVEIKCRSRDMRVFKNSEPVITSDAVRQTLDQPNRGKYEAQIYDLRALTNYTFQVRPSRFHNYNNNSDNDSEPNRPAGKALSGRGPQAARRLDDNQPGARARIETKAFGAEATKCLANVSEVLITTGRHFGGRISVENSNDPRCQLLGNRSSEQSSYLFQIDHQICHSKSTEQSIETMILVHENKDILTHSTARFLVLCNFQQKSFTLKASVSLSKVNSKLAPGKWAFGGQPALITPLSARQSVVGEHASQQQQVMLGNMPGLYRQHWQTPATTTTTSVANQSLPQASRSPQAPSQALTAGDPPSIIGGADQLELEANTIERFRAASSSLGQSSQRRAKELVAGVQSTPLDNDHDRDQQEDQRPKSAFFYAAAATTTSNTAALKPPDAKQVTSKVLYVDQSTEPMGMLRNARLRNHLHLSSSSSSSATSSSGSSTTTSATANNQATQSQTSQPNNNNLPMARIQRQSSPSAATETTAASDLSFAGDDESAANANSPPIVVTNNHRVAALSGHYLAPLQQMEASLGLNTSRPANATGGQNYTKTIRYSAASPSEFSLDRLELLPSGAASLPQARSQLRLGRMRLLESPGWKDNNNSTHFIMSRMGEEPPANTSDSAGNNNNINSTDSLELPQLANGDTLARNITNYLLRWSIRALSNLATKSIESLMKPPSSTPDESLVASPNTDSTLELVQPRQQQQQQSSQSSQNSFEPLGRLQALAGDSNKHATSTATSSTTTTSSTTATPQSGLHSARSMEHANRTSKNLPASRAQPRHQGQLLAEPDHNRWQSHMSLTWILYGLAALSTVIAGALLTLWLLASNNSSSRNTIHQNDRLQPPLVSSPASPTKSDSFKSDTLSDRALLGRTLNTSLLAKRPVGSKLQPDPARPTSPSTCSRSTRSTSVGSARGSLAGEENDCRNQEFLFTEHVLIDVDPHSGVSYA